MRILLVTLALLTVPVLAAADPAAKDAKALPVPKIKKIDMGEGEKVEGNVGTATGTGISLLAFLKANSMIHIRRDFIPEIIKSADDLD